MKIATRSFAVIRQATKAMLILGTLIPALARADITALSARPDPVRQGTSLRISAQADRPGMVYFFFKGRPFGSAVYAPRAGAVVSTQDIVPINTVPAGSSAIEKAYGAQQFGHRVSDFVTVVR